MICSHEGGNIERNVVSHLCFDSFCVMDSSVIGNSMFDYLAVLFIGDLSFISSMNPKF